MVKRHAHRKKGIDQVKKGSPLGVEIETNSAEDIRVLDFNVFIVPGEPIVESPEEEAEPEVFEWPKDSQAWDEIVISSAT